MAYHSKIAAENCEKIGNFPLLSFHSTCRGPVRELDLAHVVQPARAAVIRSTSSSIAAPPPSPPLDIVDESILYFRPNIFLSRFEIKNDSDRVLIYLTLYIATCLQRLRERCVCRHDGLLAMSSLARSRFTIPGDPNFVLNAMYTAPANKEQAYHLRQYLGQLRDECGRRLCEIVFPNEKSPASKWWLCFAKKRFLNLSLS